MELLLLFIRLILAALLATAGIAKLADLSGAEKAAQGFGVSGNLARVGPIALSVLEIAIAGSFLFPESSWYAAIAAGTLLVVFIGMMTYQWSKGNAPDCHCFGQLHSEPVGLKSIVRNVIFLAISVPLLVRGQGRQGLAIEQITAEMMPTILGGLAVIMLAGALLYLRRIIRLQNELGRRIDVLEVIAREGTAVDHEHSTDPYQGLPIGAFIPDFELPSLDGRMVTLSDIAKPGKPVLFFFVAPGCTPCQAMMPDIKRWTDDLADRVTIVFISRGTGNENKRKFSHLDSSTVLLDSDRSFAEAVGGKWTPTALLVDSNGKVLSHVAVGDTAISEQVEKIKGSDLTRPFIYFSNGLNNGRKILIGEKVPDFALPDVSGRELTSRDILGKRTLIAFWSPTCPHCSAMLEDLKHWEGTRGHDAPGLVVFSDGDPDDHRELGLRSPVVLDKGYKVAAKLGMFGTPSAILVDENGVIVTETGTGATNIWALIGKRE